MLSSPNFFRELSNQHIKDTKAKTLNPMYEQGLFYPYPFVNCHLRTARWPFYFSFLPNSLLANTWPYDSFSPIASSQSPAFPIMELRVQQRRYNLQGKMAEGRIKKGQSVLSLVILVEFILSHWNSGQVQKLIQCLGNLVSCHQVGCVLSPKTQRPYITSFCHLNEMGASEPQL